jgi:hypothetical protein
MSCAAEFTHAVIQALTGPNTPCSRVCACSMISPEDRRVWYQTQLLGMLDPPQRSTTFVKVRAAPSPCMVPPPPSTA